MTKSAPKNSVLPTPRAGLFDWDGTMVDTSAALLIAFNAVRTAFSLSPYTHDDYMQVSKIGNAREIFTSLYPDRVPQALDIFYTSIRSEYVSSQRPLDGVLAVVDALIARDIPYGIVSNLNHEVLVPCVQALGLTPAVVIGAGLAPRGKPSPDPIYLALEKLGLMRSDATDVWFVGDMETDEKASAAAGCPFRKIQRATGGAGDFRCGKKGPPEAGEGCTG